MTVDKVDADIARQIEELKQMSVGELRVKYLEVFGEETRMRHRDWLWKRIAWRIQELKYGGLSERAKRRAAEIVDEADLRIRPPRGIFDDRVEGQRSTLSAASPIRDKRLPQPGTMLTREFKGRTITVIVQADGVEYEGKNYRSLSAAAKAATGTKWNGYLFFGLE